MQNRKRSKCPMVNKSWLLLALLLMFGAVLPAQETEDAGGPPTRLDRLLENAGQMQVKVTLDRTTLYFPGETATVTVTLANPTSGPLEIPDPGAPGASAFAVSRQGDAGPGVKWGMAPFDPLPPDIPSTVVTYGDSVTLVFHPEDKLVRPWQTYGEMPPGPGKYRLYYNLLGDGAPAEFEVGAPVLEDSVIVPLQRFKTYQEKGMANQKTTQYAALAVAVRLGSEHLIFVGRKDVRTTDDVETGKDGTLTKGTAQDGAPWVRVATVPGKVTSLKATADVSGLITVEYTTADGGGGKVHLDENRRPL